MCSKFSKFSSLLMNGCKYSKVDTTSYTIEILCIIKESCFLKSNNLVNLL